MAPHDTNTERQARRHWFPLAGMAVVVALVLIGFFWWVGEEIEPIGDVDPAADGGELPEDALETTEPAAPPVAPPADVAPVDPPPANAPPADVPPVDAPAPAAPAQ